MTKRMRALLLRLAACEETGEFDQLLRRTLRDMGLTDQAIDEAVKRVRKAIEP